MFFHISNTPGILDIITNFVVCFLSQIKHNVLELELELDVFKENVLIFKTTEARIVR